jgi:hypothetical protein
MKKSKITKVTNEEIVVAPVATLKPPRPRTTMNAVLNATWAIGATAAESLAIDKPWS